MAGPYGRTCRNLHGESLHIKAKLVLDERANLHVANADASNVHISNNLFTRGICEHEMSQGITLKGNVTMSRPSDVFCASTIKANTFIGNIQGDLNLDNATVGTLNANVVNGNTVGKHTGNVCGDLIGNVCGNIVLDEISPKSSNTISVNGNLTFTSTSQSLNVNTIQTSNINPQIAASGIIVDRLLPKNSFGLARAWNNALLPLDNGNSTQIIFSMKSFESTFTTDRQIVHPDGNVLVTFQVPSVTNVNCDFTTALVKMNMGMHVLFTNGDYNDSLTFEVRRNKSDSDVVSRYIHTVTSNVANTINAVMWSDSVSLEPNDTLDVYVDTGNISGNLNASIVSGQPNTFISFEIQSFEV